jgi:hypothetical protein
MGEDAHPDFTALDPEKRKTNSTRSWSLKKFDSNLALFVRSWKKLDCGTDWNCLVVLPSLQQHVELVFCSDSTSRRFGQLLKDKQPR